MKTIVRSVVITLLLAFIGATLPAQANEFSTIVNHLKKKYRAKQMRIPFVFGLVGIGARIYTRGAVKGLKIAIFPDQDLSHIVNDRGFDSLLATSFDAKWSPMIRTFSRKEGNRVSMYAKEVGKDYQILLTALEKDNAVVLTVKLNPAQLAKFIEKHNNGESIIGELGIGNITGSKNKNVIVQSDKDKDSEPPSSSKNDPIFANATKTGDAVVEADAVVSTTDKAREISGDPNAPPPTPPVSTEPPIKADITIDTKLINLNAKVLNPAGKPLLNLQKENFALYENNVKQEISHFSPVTSPVNLVLLLDFSGSTEKKQNVIREAAKRFVDSLGPNDRVAVAAFARRFYLKTTFLSDKKGLKKLIGDIKVPSSGTAYYDAMWKSLDLFKQANGSRNAIVVLTDGVDNTIMDPEEYTTKHEFNELLARISEEDVTIYPMYLDTEYEMVVKRHGGQDKHEHYAIARKQLAQVAEQSGGLVFHVANIEDLNGIYDRVAAELKTLYSIAYSSSLDDGSRTQKKEWREIKLTVNEPGANARTKRGYYAR